MCSLWVHSSLQYLDCTEQIWSSNCSQCLSFVLYILKVSSLGATRTCAKERILPSPKPVSLFQGALKRKVKADSNWQSCGWSHRLPKTLVEVCPDARVPLAARAASLEMHHHLGSAVVRSIDFSFLLRELRNAMLFIFNSRISSNSSDGVQLIMDFENVSCSSISFRNVTVSSSRVFNFSSLCLEGFVKLLLHFDPHAKERFLLLQSMPFRFDRLITRILG